MMMIKRDLFAQIGEVYSVWARGQAGQNNSIKAETTSITEAEEIAARNGGGIITRSSDDRRLLTDTNEVVIGGHHVKRIQLEEYNTALRPLSDWPEEIVRSHLRGAVARQSILEEEYQIRGSGKGLRNLRESSEQAEATIASMERELKRRGLASGNTEAA